MLFMVFFKTGPLNVFFKVPKIVSDTFFSLFERYNLNLTIDEEFSKIIGYLMIYNIHVNWIPDS